MNSSPFMAVLIPGVSWVPACASLCTAVTAAALARRTCPLQGSAFPYPATFQRQSSSCSYSDSPSPRALRISRQELAFERAFTSAGFSRRSCIVGSGDGMAAEVAKRTSESLPPPQGYRANVGICLVNSNNKVFVASRIDKPGSWQMPQGGIDTGEDPTAAARRELREETGVVSADFVAEVSEWLCYDFPPDVRAKLTIAWGKEWQGQAQKWFLFRFTGKDENEITLLGDGSEPPEFDDWKWMDVPAVIDAAVEFKKPVYEAAFRVFEPYLK